MNLKRILLLVLLTTAAPILLRAATNVWPFTTSSQYTVSDPDKIEVADGVAKLKLKASQNYQSTIAQYLTNTAVRTGLSVGPDSSIALTRLGSLYSGFGRYTSRVLDGGDGNTWQKLYARAFGRTGSTRGLWEMAPEAGLVALYHFNNSPADTVSGSSGVPFGAPSYTTDAKLGSHALTLNGSNYLQAANATLLNGATEATLACWIKLTSYRNYGGIIYSQGSGNASILGLTQSSGGRVAIARGDRLVVSASTIEVGKWAMIVGTWRSAGGVGTVYVNGKLDASGYLGGLAYAQSDFFKIGFDDEPYLGPRITTGVFDEVAIYNRVLTATEVSTLYQRGAATFGMQIRSGSSPDLTGMFVGPDGSSNSYFLAETEPLTAIAGFDPLHRYAQYQAYMVSDQTQTPYLDAAGFYGTLSAPIDNVMGDFMQGEYTENTTNLPAKPDTPFLGLAKEANGGFFTNGTYTSRVLDGEAGVTWGQLSWKFGEELSGDMSGLEGLWHANGTWSDASPRGNSGAGFNIGYTDYAKLGSLSPVFNGVNSYALISSISAGIQSVEWWMKSDQLSDGILELVSGATYVAMSNRQIQALGYPTGAVVTIYVNGRAGYPLINGWNHVAVVSDRAVANVAMAIGRANGDYYQGSLDEIAVFSRALSPAEVTAHYLSGRRTVAGKIRVQVRGSSSGTPTGAFTGPGAVAGFFDDPNGTSLAGYTNRYLQYRVTMLGDGEATPSLDALTITRSTGAAYVDDTIDEIKLGTFDAGRTRWYGDEMTLVDLVAVGAPAIDPIRLSGFAGIWHMDEAAWLSGSSVRDSSGSGNNGSPEGDAKPTSTARVGAYAGTFDGNGDDIVIPAINLGSDDFSVGGWVKSTATNYAAVISTFGGTAYYALEFNGNGIGALPGRASFVINDGSGMRVATGAVGPVNDGAWHHLTGVRNGRQIHIYVDGVLAGSADLGASYGSLGQVQAYLARYGTLSRFYQGILDEVFVARRALTSAEIGGLAGVGVDTLNAGQYTSSVFDGEQISIWESLRWGADAPYSKPQQPGDPFLSGLWHFDAVTNGNQLADASGQANHATLYGGTISPTGRFSGSLRMAEGQGHYAEVADDLSLESAQFTIEAWVRPETVNDAVILDKRDAGAPGVGYRLGLDGAGRPYFWVNGAACTNNQALRSRQWWHLAGVYDGARLRLYVNGVLSAVGALFAADVNTAGQLRIGLGYDGGGDFAGFIDEAAVRLRVVSGEELADHYRAGVGTFRFQARSWTTNAPGLFTGPDGTSGSYYTESALSDLMASIPLNQYFQYRADLATEDFAVSPRFQGARVDISSYPQDHPWVTPATPFTFYGNLLGFSHVMATNLDTAVRYQVSGNGGTNWYYWNGTTWEDVTLFGWDLANTYSTVNANIASLFTLLYPKTGGGFKFKAFLHSGGSDQTALDSVSLGYSVGRLVVTVPNGEEVGEKAWVVGTTNIIRWAYAGTISPNVVLEYSDNGGTSWSTITSNAPVASGEYAWLVPGAAQSAERSNCRIRIRDPNDATIWDISDSSFEIVYRYRIVSPNGGEKWYIGQTNRIVWQSPPNLARAWLYYNRNGSTTDWVRLTTDIITTPVGTNNFYLWNTPTTNNEIISERARIRITLEGSPVYGDYSDGEYTMAGFGFLAPLPGAAWKRGSLQTIRWLSAGAGTNGVTIEFAGDGVTWVPVATGVTNITGTNSYQWLVTADNPTPLARLRITSIGDPNVRNMSQPFTVADIDIKRPLAEDVWPQNTTNQIQWTAGGAGNSVNIYYSTNDGVAWTLVRAAYTNLDFPTVNSYAWTVPPYPGPARVKIESTLGGGELFAVSPLFNIGGVRIVAPNGGELWRLGALHAIQWVEAAAGGGALLEFSYDNGATYTNVAGPGYAMAARTVDFVPGFPSAQCRARIQASDAGLDSIADVSDDYFTVAGVKVVRPALAQTYTMGINTNNGLVWYSAGTLDDNVEVYYSPEDGRETLLLSTPNRETYPGDNTRDWQPLYSLDPSDVARIKVLASSASGVYTGLSDRFTLRGVRLTQPGTGTIFRVGAQETVQWISAGFLPGASAYFYVSTDGGATFGTEPLVPWTTLLDVKQAYWDVAPDMDPTTNAVLKLSVTNGGIAFDAVSPRFTLRGIKVLNPASTNNWAIGSTNTIRFLAAAVGNLVNIYYAQDGVNYDTANPVGLNVPVTDGLNTFNWTIESFREPTTSARIKIQAATQPDSAVSQTFTVGGIKVLRPLSIDIWSIGETNRIQWLSIGTQGTNTIELLKPGNVVIPIVSGWAGAYYDWAVPPEAVGSNLQIRVTDTGGFSGLSQPFRIVTEPTVQIIAPAAGEFWKLTEAHTIRWTRAGNMGDLFTVEYSLNDFVTSIQILGTPVFTGGVYELTWTPEDPARLGAARLRVTNTGNTNITDTTATFYLVPKIEIRSPNGGEDFYALKPTIVEWLTKGAVTQFDLYYSTDLTRRTNRWVKVNTTGFVIGKGHDELSQYLWTVSDVKSPVVWIRLQDANYQDMYPFSQPGPFDDCDATFAIKYYTINWHVYNAASSNVLDQLSVTDSSGWSESGLRSDPYVLHEYPYGVFDTVWSREYFYDKVVFNWIPEPSRTIEVPMNQSEVAPDYRVMANFVFDKAAGVFQANTWLERAGRILIGATRSVITIYDSSGAQVAQIETVSPDANGVFWQTLPGILDPDRSYFAKAEVQFSGVLYSSGITFNLRVPAADEQAQQLLALLESVNTNVTDLAAAQSAFRASATAKLDTLTNIIGQVTGLTNLEARLDTFSTQALARLDTLTNTIGVIGPSETNLFSTVRAFREESLQRTARLLTRPTTVKLGDRFNVLFRSRPGTVVTIAVSNLTAGAWRYSSTMTEMAGGVYEKYMTANWGTGDCLVACADELGGLDSMIVKVVMTDLDDLAVALTNVNDSLNQVELRLVGLASSVSNIDTSVSGLATNLAGLIADVDTVYAVVSNLQATINWTNVTDILGAVRGMSNDIAALSTNFNAVNWTNLADLASLGPQLSDVLTSVSNLQATIDWSDVVTLLGAVDSISNRLDGLTNLPVQMTAVADMLGQMGPLTNLGGQVAALTNSLAQISALTNVAPQVNYLTNLLTRMSGVTNLLPQVAYLTNVIDQVTFLTNLGTQVSAMTNAIGQITVLTNFAPQIAYLTNSMGQVLGLTNLSAQMAGVTNAMGQIAGLTNFGPQIAYLTNAAAVLAGQETYLTNLLTRMSGVTNLLPQVAYLTNVIDQVTFLTNLTPQVAIMTNAIGQITVLTNFAPQLAYITNTMGAVVSLTNLTPQMAAVTGIVGQISSLTNFGPQIAYVTSVIGQVTAVTNLGSQIAYLTNLVAGLGGLTNSAAVMQGQVGYLTNLLTRMSSLTNLTADVAYLTNVIDSVSGITNIGPDISRMTNAVAMLTGLTNMGVQLTYLTNAVTQLGPMTNAIATLSSQGAYLTNLVSRMSGITNMIPQLSALTNVPAQMLYLTNAMAQMGALTNLGGQIDVMTNAIGQLARLTNIPDQVAYLTNVIGQISGVTNIPDQVAAMTNSIAQVARLTNVPDQVAYLTNVIAQISGVTNIPDQVAAMTNSIAQVARLTNVPDQVAYLTNVIAQLGGITNLGPQVDAMTNAIGQIASLTNLSDQVGYLTNAVGALGGLTNLAFSMDYATNLLGRMAGLTNLETQVALLQSTLDPLSVLTNMPDRLGGVESLLGGLASLTNLPGQVEALTNSIATLGSLTNMGATVNSLTNLFGQVGLLTNLPVQVTALGDSIAALSDLTNMTDRVNALTNAVAQLTALTNLSSQVAAMTNIGGRVDQILGDVTTLLGGLAGVSAGVSNLQTTIDWADITALAGQVSGVSNDLSALATAFAGVNWTNLAQIGTLGTSVSNIGASLNALRATVNWTNVLDILGTVSTLSNDVSTLSGTLAAVNWTNLTALAPRMDAVYAAVTGLQGVVNWADVTALLGTSADISNTVTLLRTQIEAVNWTNLASIGPLGAGISNVFAVVTNLQSTIRWSDIAGLQSTVTNSTFALSNAWATVQERIGAETDPATQGTVFGRLTALSDGLVAVGDAASSAATAARTAKTQATAASGAASAVRTQLEEAQFSQMLGALTQMRASLDATLQQVKGIPDAMSTETLVKSLRDTMGKIDEISRQRLGAPMGMPEGVEEGSLSDPKAVARLLNTISETKAMMEAMRLLMDEAVNKPVVVDWLEGSQ